MSAQLNQLIKAQEFAYNAHKGQVRKYTGEPYIIHPQEVAMIVQQVSVRDNNDDVCAALMHDVIEDTDVTYEDIVFEFGMTIADLVAMVTDVSTPDNGNRAARKAIDRAHIAKACRDMQTVKVADFISNTKSIVAGDPDFAKVYLVEKAEALKVLTKADQSLREYAYKLIIEGQIYLDNLALQEALRY